MILHPRQGRVRVRPCVDPRAATAEERWDEARRGSVNGRAAGHAGSESRKNMSSFHRQSSQRAERTYQPYEKPDVQTDESGRGGDRVHIRVCVRV